MESQEAHAALIKGFLLGNSCPQEIMNSVDALLRQSRQTTTPEDNCKTYTPGEDNQKDVEFPPAARLLRKLQDGAPRPKKDTIGLPAPDCTTILHDGTELEKSAPKKPQAEQSQKKRARKCKLEPAANLSEIQSSHDAGQANGTIAERYGVSDQTIINFLRQHGSYAPKGRGTRGAARPKYDDDADGDSDPEPARDAFGDTLIEAAPRRARKSTFNAFTPSKPSKSAYAGQRDDGMLHASDLVDIHDMLAAGLDMHDIAEKYGCPKADVEAFVLLHRNVQITKYEAAHARGSTGNNHMVKPALRGRGSD